MILEHEVRKLQKHQQNSNDWSVTYMETNLLLNLDSLIIFGDVALLLVPVFPTLLDPAATFLCFLPPLTFLLFFFFSWEGGEGGGGGGEGRDSFIAFLSSGVR